MPSSWTWPDRPQPLGSVVWINGAFGAGKSTVAKRLSATMPDAAVFDPEPLARLIRDAMPPSRRPSDYQDSALWRHLTGFTGDDRIAAIG